MINYLSLFSGIGAFEKAMMNQDIPFNLVGYSEIDKYASKSYSAIYGVDESKNLGDITKIDEKTLPPVDFITYGFPCQDISLAGKQKGLFNEDGTQTRSGLFFDALRIIEAAQPKVAIAENVKNLVSKKFKEQFEIVLNSLEDAGYNNYWKILNSKDFGIPQNRERVFIVSIRKDCDTGVFEFPEPYELKLRLKDMLEDEVDEKFYVSNKMTEYLINTQFHQDSDTIQKGDICKCLRVGGTTSCVEEQPTLIGGMQKNQAVKTDGVCTTLTSSMGTGGGYVPMVTEPFIAASRGRNPENPSDRTVGSPTQQRLEPNNQGICNTLTTVQKDNYLVEPQQLRIRKLTPKECFRLMGFDDESFHKAEAVNSNTQLYKQAGNSIVVDVAEELLCMMFDEDGEFYI